MLWRDLVDYSGFYNDLVATIQVGRAGGQSVDQVVSSYVLPAQYSDFQVADDRLRSVVQYVFNSQ